MLSGTPYRGNYGNSKARDYCNSKTEIQYKVRDTFHDVVDEIYKERDDHNRQYGPDLSYDRDIEKRINYAVNDLKIATTVIDHHESNFVNDKVHEKHERNLSRMNKSDKFIKSSDFTDAKIFHQKHKDEMIIQKTRMGAKRENKRVDAYKLEQDRFTKYFESRCNRDIDGKTLDIYHKDIEFVFKNEHIINWWNKELNFYPEIDENEIVFSQIIISDKVKKQHISSFTTDSVGRSRFLNKSIATLPLPCKYINIQNYCHNLYYWANYDLFFDISTLENRSYIYIDYMALILIRMSLSSIRTSCFTEFLKLLGKLKMIENIFLLSFISSKNAKAIRDLFLIHILVEKSWNHYMDNYAREDDQPIVNALNYGDQISHIMVIITPVLLTLYKKSLILNIQESWSMMAVKFFSSKVNGTIVEKEVKYRPLTVINGFDQEYGVNIINTVTFSDHKTMTVKDYLKGGHWVSKIPHRKEYPNGLESKRSRIVISSSLFNLFISEGLPNSNTDIIYKGFKGQIMESLFETNIDDPVISRIFHLYDMNIHIDEITHVYDADGFIEGDEEEISKYEHMNWKRTQILEADEVKEFICLCGEIITDEHRCELCPTARDLLSISWV